ncbi:hypothetical protein K443DRAFT_678215 [Laccaria amethystina LaAM-08-1]|uniref:Uncharacterized protein n=1 Tax=Laccaria amethystina LaAM-08-1 TaxID=1095629 RepID=A0A0C9Y0S9_9AGAR|nr:hypothetical protein K443DRAFT_678215 [Laccaria amethystina LaAM-08-1]
MPSSTQGHQASYDESLLAAAPAATKQQIQGGYNPDLLKEKVSASVTPPPRDVEAQLPSREVSITPAPTPFYRTKKGLIIIAVAAVVIIAAVVGGAVGGSKKHKNSELSAVTSSTSSSPSASQSGGSQEGGALGPSVTNAEATTLPSVSSAALPTTNSVPLPFGSFTRSATASSSTAQPAGPTTAAQGVNPGSNP